MIVRFRYLDDRVEHDEGIEFDSENLGEVLKVAVAKDSGRIGRLSKDGELVCILRKSAGEHPFWEVFPPT